MDLQYLNDLCLLFLPLTVSCVMCYFLIYAIINIRYVVKTRNNPVRKDHPEYFKNEVIVCIMSTLIIFIYPIIFIFNIPNNNIKAQIYFHLWNSLSWHIPGWLIYLFFARRNDRRKNRGISYIDFKAKILKNYQDDFKSDVKRKLMHLISSAIMISFFIIAVLLEQYLFIPESSEWTTASFAVYMQLNVGIHFQWAMNIAEYLRLQKFEKFGQVGRNWLESAIRPKELDTYSAATIMGLSLSPFFLAPQHILISVALISSLSDAMASIIGKRFGKIRNKKSKKTVEGYIAGFITTYLIVIIVNSLVLPYTNVIFKIPFCIVTNLMALGAAVGFLLVDIYAKQISDNFLNPIVSGGLLTIVFIIFII